MKFNITRNLLTIIGFSLFAGTVRAMTPLPASLDTLDLPTGWIHAKNYQFFNDKTLYGYINGESETFFPYGFKQLTVFEVYPEAAPKEQVSLQVYAMGSNLDAFGIYSTYRQPADTFIEVGNEGFIGDTQLVFYQDAYFVKVHFLQPRGDKADLLAVAKAVSAVLPESAGEPGELAIMNLPGLVPQSVKYLARSVLGQAQFTHGLQAEIVPASGSGVAEDTPTVTVTVVVLDDADAAGEGLRAYLADLKMFDGVIRHEETPAGVVNVIEDPSFERGLIAREGRHLIFYTTAPAEAEVSAKPFNLLRERVRGVGESANQSDTADS